MIQLPSLSTLILLHAFPAFLPLVPEDETSYYEALELTKSASQEDIRKAYRKISLQLHPDKLQQRGLNPKDYESQYQLVQEAYTVLSDKKKRTEYNHLGDSPSRYQFVASGNLYNPGVLYENIATANISAKTRIVMLVALLITALLLQPILICVEINQLFKGGAIESTPWILLLIPTWILQGLICIILAGIVMVVENKAQIAISCLGNLSWLVGMILLALRWDRTIEVKYVLLFIPFYIYLATGFLSSLLSMREIQIQINKMITPRDLEEVLQKPLNTLDEEELTALDETYIIVHLPSQETEGETVEVSPEYEAALEMYYQDTNSILQGIAFKIPLIVLIVLKIDGTLMNTNWWLIFMPVWIYLFLNGIYNSYSCCWAVGSEIVVNHMEADLDDYTATPTPRQEEAESSTDHMFVPAETNDVTEFTNSPMSKKKAPDDESNARTNTASSAVVPIPPKAAAPTTAATTTSPEKFVDEFRPSKVTPLKEPASNPDIETTTPNLATEHGDDTYIDAETFAEWNQAYQEAQASAMEVQAKAQLNCCFILVQVMMLSLIVGKLEQSYTKTDGGFNAMWVLFPIFLLSGCIFSCCACLIYGAGTEGLDGIVSHDASMGDKKKDGDEEEAIIPEPSSDSKPPAVEVQVAEPVAAAATPERTGFNADELD